MQIITRVLPSTIVTIGITTCMEMTGMLTINLLFDWTLLETNRIWLLFCKPGMKGTKHSETRETSGNWPNPLTFASLPVNSGTTSTNVRIGGCSTAASKASNPKASKAPRFSFPCAKYPKPSHCHADVARLQWTPSTSRCLNGKMTLEMFMNLREQNLSSSNCFPNREYMNTKWYKWFFGFLY